MLKPVRKRWWMRRLAWTAGMLFLLLNLVAALHAWRFTHFAPANATRTKTPDQLSLAEKMKVALTGISLPKPVTHFVPGEPYESITLPEGTTGWWIPASGNIRGTVVLAHGYGSEKSSMLGRAAIFRKRGYHTLLIDLSGAGESGNETTTIGYKEASQISAAAAFVREKNAGKLFLFGASMGAVAIMRAISEQGLKADGIMLECPFSTMYKTVCKRFQIAGIPEFPMAGLLTFWGGILNDFNAFSHSPVEYARNIHCPALLIRGERDPLVGPEEIEQIYAQLPGIKQNFSCPEAGHFDFLAACPQAWQQAVTSFLENCGGWPEKAKPG